MVDVCGVCGGLKDCERLRGVEVEFIGLEARAGQGGLEGRSGKRLSSYSLYVEGVG